MSKLKRPLTKNFYLSLTGKEPVLNNFSLYNQFPMGLMIISKLDPTSCSRNNESSEEENGEIEVKIKYINQIASELFEIKENDENSKIHEQLKQFKKYDNVQTTEETLDNILFKSNRENEFYGSFKYQASLIYVKYKLNNEDLYICTDYYTDERKIMQNQLFQSLKFQYIATLFHELYNPINSLLIMIDVNQDEDGNNDDVIRSNLKEQNISEIDELHNSVISESSNMLEKEISKNKKCYEMYKSKLIDLHEKEKDISLLVNMIYIFLENLILYLRINLGVNFNKNEAQQKEEYNNENIRNSNNNNSKEEEEKNSENNIINKKESKANEKESNIHKVYTDNYLTDLNKNKKLNLEFSFYKHLNKFSYLFEFKNIQYCNDFSYLSDKYILTDESIFMDFIGQIYSFLYYVVPKSQGFEVAYSLISENKMKILFQKSNFPSKGGYRFKKMRRDNSCIICEDKFKATSTVKTPEMTQEILYKLSEILGIKLKIMEYEDQKEDIYLTIIMPYFIDVENDFVDSDIDELPEVSPGKIPYLDKVLERNILNSNINDQSEIEDEINKIKEKNDDKSKMTIKISCENNSNLEIIKNIDKNLSPNNNLSLNNKNKLGNNLNNLNLSFYKFTPERKATFLIEQVDEQNSSEEDVYSNSEEEEKEKNGKDGEISEFKEEIKIGNLTHKNYTKKKSYKSSHSKSHISKSSLNNVGLTSKRKSLFKSKSPITDQHLLLLQSNFNDFSNNYLNKIVPVLTHKYNKNSKDMIFNEISNMKDNTLKTKYKKAKSLISRKYSNIEIMKKRGVEILKENEEENKKENENVNENENERNGSFSLEPINSSNNKTSYKDKKSIKVEADSYNYIEIDNEDIEDLENEINSINKNEEININQILNNKFKNSFLLNLNYNNLIRSPKNDRSKNKIITGENRLSNKTLDYNKSNNENLFSIKGNELIEKEEVSGNISKKVKINNNQNSSSNCNCNCKDILLVDDDEFICKTSKNILKSFKLEADFASDGQECLNKIKEKQEKNCNCSKNKYKLVLMDITMPIMDGIEAAKNIQKMIDENKLYNTIKVIFISAHVNLDLSSIMNGIKCAIDYYAKPISGVKYKALLDKYYYSK